MDECIAAAILTDQIGETTTLADPQVVDGEREAVNLFRVDGSHQSA